MNRYTYGNSNRYRRMNRRQRRGACNREYVQVLNAWQDGGEDAVSSVAKTAGGRKGASGQKKGGYGEVSFANAFADCCYENNCHPVVVVCILVFLLLLLLVLMLCLAGVAAKMQQSGIR